MADVTPVTADMSPEEEKRLMDKFFSQVGYHPKATGEIDPDPSDDPDERL